jgi:hypothetical protein
MQLVKPLYGAFAQGLIKKAVNGACGTQISDVSHAVELVPIGHGTFYAFQELPPLIAIIAAASVPPLKEDHNYSRVLKSDLERGRDHEKIYAKA